MTPSPIAPMPAKRTAAAYRLQGWNAARAGYQLEQCPYYETSPAWRLWREGFRST